MRIAIVLSAFALAGCITMAPQEMARQSNYDVCRFTMGGPHAAVADNEARRRNLDCSQMYGAITARERANNDAVNNYLRATRPPPPAHPVNCTSYRVGTTVETTCR
jgi:hypothetical protein